MFLDLLINKTKKKEERKMRMQHLWFRFTHSEWVQLGMLPGVVTAYVVLSVTEHLALDALMKRHDLPMFLLTVRYFVLCSLLGAVVFFFRDFYLGKYEKWWLSEMTSKFYVKRIVPLGFAVALDSILVLITILKHSLGFSEVIFAFLPCLMVLSNWQWSLKEYLTSKKITATVILAVAQAMMGYSNTRFRLSYLILAGGSTVLNLARLVLYERVMLFTADNGLHSSAIPRFEHAYEVDSFAVDVLESEQRKYENTFNRGDQSAIRSIFDPQTDLNDSFFKQADIAGSLASALVETDGPSGGVFGGRRKRSSSFSAKAQRRRHHAMSLTDRWRRQMPTVLLLLYVMPICLLISVAAFFIFDLDRMSRKHKDLGTSDFLWMLIEFGMVSLVNLAVSLCEIYIISVISAVCLVFCDALHSQIILALSALFFTGKSSTKLHIASYVGYALCLIALLLYLWSKVSLQSEIERDLEEQTRTRKSRTQIRKFKKRIKRSEDGNSIMLGIDDELSSVMNGMHSGSLGGGNLTGIQAPGGHAYFEFEVDLDLEDSLNAAAKYKDSHDYNPAFTPSFSDYHSNNDPNGAAQRDRRLSSAAGLNDDDLSRF